MRLSLTLRHSQSMTRGPINGISVNILASQIMMMMMMMMMIKALSARMDLEETMTLETMRLLMQLI